MQGGQPAEAQKDDGGGRHQQPPHHCLPARGGHAFVAGGDVVEDVNAGVGGGDEEEGDHHEADKPCEGRQGEVFEEAEEEFFGRAGQFAQCACCGVVVNPDGGIAEDGEPDDAEQGGNRQNAENEFAYGASARDAGDEESDERRPRTPPCPV